MKISAITQMMLSTLCANGLLSAADVPPAAVAIAPSQELLSAAVSRGDVTAVRELLLRGGVSLPTDSIEYDSLVRAAALCGNPDMFDYIPYREPVAGHADSPLIVALRAGASPAMISAMLSAGNAPGAAESPRPRLFRRHFRSTVTCRLSACCRPLPHLNRSGLRDRSR